MIFCRVLFLISLFFLLSLSLPNNGFADELIISKDQEIPITSQNTEIDETIFPSKQWDGYGNVLGSTSGVTITVLLSPFLPIDTPRPTNTPTPTLTPTPTMTLTPTPTSSQPSSSPPTNTPTPTLTPTNTPTPSITQRIQT